MDVFALVVALVDVVVGVQLGHEDPVDQNVGVGGSGGVLWVLGSAAQDGEGQQGRAEDLGGGSEG